MAQSKTPLLPNLISIALLILGMVGIATLQMPQLKAFKTETKDYTPETLKRQEEVEKVHLDFLENMPSFGFDNLVADWVFLDFLGYFGDSPARNEIGYSLSLDYFEVILDRDPWFREGYLYLSGSVSMYSALPEATVAWMEKGLQQMTPTLPHQSYYIWRYRGIDELLFLGDAQASQTSFQTASEWAKVYEDEESQQISKQSQETAQFLANNPESKFAQVSAWTMVLQNAKDDQTRGRAVREIEALGGRVEKNEEGQYRIIPPSQD